jgi:hypothetical protein
LRPRWCSTQAGHPHERNYQNSPSLNGSYAAAAHDLARQLRPELQGRKVLVYAPLRGALPIWTAIRHLMPELDMTAYHPVTSSFVFFPEEFRVLNAKGRNASGRFNHMLEMQRQQPCLDQFDCLLYPDEIVSGGMMHGYVRDMEEMGIHLQIPLYAAGIADALGIRSEFNRTRLQRMVDTGVPKGFSWSGCEVLITEDHKFLLRMHYADYVSGLHAIPVLDPFLEDFEEKRLFEQDISAAGCG